MTTRLKRDRLIEAAKAKFYQQGFSHRPDLVLAGNVCLDGELSFT